MAYTPPTAPLTLTFGGPYTPPTSPLTLTFGEQIGVPAGNNPITLIIEVVGNIPAIPVTYPESAIIEVVGNTSQQKTYKGSAGIIEIVGNTPRQSKISPEVGVIIIEGNVPAKKNEPATGIIIVAGNTPQQKTYKALAGIIEIVGNIPSIGTTATISIVEHQPIVTSFILSFISKKQVSARLWFLTLSDTQSTVTIPMTNFTESLTQKKYSYQITIPNGEKYLSEVVGKENFIIKSREIYVDNTYKDTQTDSIEISSIQPYQGGSNYSIVILGSINASTPVPKKLKIQGVRLKSLSTTGLQVIQCNNDMDFLEGDTAILQNSDEIVIGTITRVISANEKSMRLTELG